MFQNRKPIIGLTADFDLKYLPELEKLGEVRLGGWGVTGSVPETSELIEFLQGIDILILAWENVDATVLEATSLAYIASVRGGPGGNVDLEVATRLKIPVTGTIGREALPVAEFTFGLMIGLLRRISWTSHLLRTRELTSFEPQPAGDIGWGMEPEDPWIYYRGEDLATKRLGLVGFGTVGHMVARRALAFDMEVVAYDPYAKPVDGVHFLELEELMSSSDIVSIHARYSPETHHLVGAEQIAKMKASSVLINTARPNLVDRAALLRALQTGAISGAAMDVHVKEPIDPDDPFLELKNVVLTPHIAGSSYGVTRVQTEQVIDNVRRFLAGEPLVALANPVGSQDSMGRTA